MKLQWTEWKWCGTVEWHFYRVWIYFGCLDLPVNYNSKSKVQDSGYWGLFFALVYVLSELILFKKKKIVRSLSLYVCGWGGAVAGGRFKITVLHHATLDSIITYTSRICLKIVSLLFIHFLFTFSKLKICLKISCGLVSPFPWVPGGLFCPIFSVFLHVKSPARY